VSCALSWFLQGVSIAAQNADALSWLWQRRPSVCPGPKIVFFDTKCAVGNGDCAVEIYLTCSSILAMKWSNMTDFKWKSGNLVSLSCSVIMSNFHYGDLHSCTYRVLYLLY